MIAFLERLQENMKSFPDKPALGFSLDDKDISYGELDEISGKVHRWLTERGIGKEDNVLIKLPRGSMIMAMIIGIWKNGSACIVCESNMAEERIRYILADSDAKVAITEEELKEIFDCEPLPGFADADPHDRAYIVYTSGSTGNPKGVIHEYGNIDENVRNKQYDGKPICREFDIFAVNAPLNFVAAMDFFVNILAVGATYIVVDTDTVKNPAKLTDFYASRKVTATFMTPSLFRSIAQFNPQMSWMEIGGEPCVKLLHDQITLYNGYNMSEAGRDIALFRIKEPMDLTPVGKNRGGEEIFIIDEEGRPVPDGETGEICFRNEYVRGYIGLPEKTAESWRNGLFFTGDLGIRLPDGNLILRGRKDDMIKIAGNRIEPEEIASAAKRVLRLRWAVAKGFITPERSFVVLYYTDDVNLDPDKSRKALAKVLTSYMLPSYFIKLDKVPLLPNGKLDKKALPVPDLNLYRAEYKAPGTELEKRLLAAFEKVLEMKHLGVNDDFFELGGDSLRAIMLITNLGDPVLNVPLLYKNRTIRTLAKAMHEDKINQGKSIEHRDGNAREHAQPLVPMQYHLLDNQLYRPSSTMSNMPIFWRMPKEDVDTGKLLHAFEVLIKSHPAFQSFIRLDEDLMYVQYMDPDYMPDLKIEQVTEKELESIKENLIQPFKLLNSPLYRFRIFETESCIYVFMDFHHIFSDGESVMVVMRDFSDAYHGRVLPRDNAYLFLRDTQKHFLNGDYEKAHAWNLKKFSGKDWVRNITPDMESRNNHASSLTAPFPMSRAELNAYLEKEHMTLNSLAIAACLLTIHEYEHKDDIMVSWLFHGRDQTAYQNCVAPLIRELPAAVSFDQVSSMKDLINEVREQTEEGINNADDPYILRTTSVDLNDTFRIRNQGVMRNIRGIDGIPSEKVDLVHESAVAGRMNLQLLEDPSGELSLCLTYGDQWYLRETVEKVMQLIRENIIMIVRDN